MSTKKRLHIDPMDCTVEVFKHGGRTYSQINGRFFEATIVGEKVSLKRLVDEQTDEEAEVQLTYSGLG